MDKDLFQDDRTSDKATALAIERLFDVADTLRLQAKEGL